MTRSHVSTCWRAAALLVLAVLAPGVLHAVDESKPAPPSAIEAEIRRLERAIDSQRALLDSLSEFGSAQAESLRDAAADALSDLSDKLELEQEKLHDAQESLEEIGHAELPRPPLPPGRRKKVAEGIIRFKEDVQVRRDESVNGDAIVVGGDLLVDGEVDGDAIVLAGNLQLGRDAIVRGQAIAVGGRVETNSGAEIEGQTVSLTLFPREFPWSPSAWPAWVGLVTDLVKLGFLVLISGLLLALVPDRLLRARSLLAESFLRCFGIGLLVLAGGSAAVTVSIILLAVTLVGIPAALVLSIAVAVLLLASLLVGVLLIGDRLQELMQRPARAPLYSVLLGLVLLLLPEILADFLHLTLPLPFPHLGLGLLSALLVIATTAAGLGALVLSRFGGSWSRQSPQSVA